MEKKLIYENKVNQMGVDEDGNIIDLCLNESEENNDLDFESMMKIINVSVQTQRLKKLGTCGN